MLLQDQQVEAKVFDIEEYRKQRIGREAIKISAEELGYSDVLTYLYRYLENSNADILPDLEADVGECLKEVDNKGRLKMSNHFENHVYFKPVGSDFVSLKDKVSLTEMTSRSVQLSKKESAKNPKLKNEYERAKLESREIAVISEWFKNAGEGSFLVFESPPLVEGEDFAVTRIYQRLGNTLEGCFISLNNPSLVQFNKLRKELNAGKNDCETALETLGSPYTINKPRLSNTDEFIDYYVGIYDHLLYENNQKYYSFGFETPEGSENQNGLDRVRTQPKLLKVFTDTIKLLAESEGKMTPEIMNICNDFEVKNVFEGQKITSKQARDILKKVFDGVVGSFSKIDQETLMSLEALDNNSSASYDTVVYSSNDAFAKNESYGGVCPSFSVSEDQKSDVAAGYEQTSILRAFNIFENLNNFGKPKMGVCRIPNCPSHGESNYFPNKTLVGGCEICVHCHKILSKGKSPESVYEEEKNKRKAEEKKNKELIARRNTKKREDELAESRKRKRREQETQRLYAKLNKKVK